MNDENLRDSLLEDDCQIIQEGGQKSTSSGKYYQNNGSASLDFSKK